MQEWRRKRRMRSNLQVLDLLSGAGQVAEAVLAAYPRYTSHQYSSVVIGQYSSVTSVLIKKNISTNYIVYTTQCTMYSVH